MLINVFTNLLLDYKYRTYDFKVFTYNKIVI